ncbi:MAG: SdpI family protein [Acidobacteriota bacterium]
MTALQILVAASNVFCALLLGGLSIPLLQERIAPNRLYGVRFKKSFESEENWYRINRYGGKLLLYWSVVVGIIGLLALTPPVGRSEGLAFAFAMAPILVVIPCWQAYRFAQRL